MTPTQMIRNHPFASVALLALSCVLLILLGTWTLWRFRGVPAERVPVEEIRDWVRQELDVRDSINQAAADSIMAATDSIMTLLEGDGGGVSAAGLTIQLARQIRTEHQIIMENQAASRAREIRLQATLVNSICWWTRDTAQVCRGGS